MEKCRVCSAIFYLLKLFSGRKPRQPMEMKTMDYRDKCNAVHLLEMIVSRDAEILDGMMPEYACINVLIESIWNHGMYEVMSQILQSRNENKKLEEIPGFEGTEDALEQLSHCYKTGNDL